MEGYLEHLRSLRKHISDYEDKAAVVSAQKHRQEAAIRAMEKDLESLDAESKRIETVIDELGKQRGVVSTAILKDQREILKLDKDAATLSDALEVLKKDTVVQSESLSRKKAHFDNLSAELYAQFELYKSKATVCTQCGVERIADEQEEVSVMES